MKKFKFLLVFLLFFSMTYYSEATGVFPNFRHQRHERHHGHHGHGHGHHGGGHQTPVRAPLDGGLLTILGAAGVTYYLVRKKKNKNSEV